MWARSWSMGRMPLHTMAALEERKDGNTSPGQSHSIRESLRYSVCRIYMYMSTCMSHMYIHVHMETCMYIHMSTCMSHMWHNTRDAISHTVITWCPHTPTHWWGAMVWSPLYPPLILLYLEVFGSPWSGRDWHFLALEQGIDGGTLPNIGIANLTHVTMTT